MYKWDPEESLRLIEAERITSFNGVPTMSWEMVQSPNFHKYDTRSLKSMGGGGAAMAPEHSRQIAKELKSGVPGTGYGMTETNGLGTSISGADLLERGTQLRPADSADGRRSRSSTPTAAKCRAVKPARSGSTVRMNFRGYWNKPDATRETLKDGWVCSGDIGHMDNEDFVFITDRAKDMVIRGGENIGCQEVEAAIYDHPCVSECAVFGVPDERLGESIAAVVMVKPNMRCRRTTFARTSRRTWRDSKCRNTSGCARSNCRASRPARSTSAGLREEAIASLQSAGRKVSA